MSDLDKVTINGKPVTDYLNYKDACHYTIQEKKGKRFNKSKKLKDRREQVRRKDKLPGKCKHYKGRKAVKMYQLKKEAKNMTIVEVCLSAIYSQENTAIQIYKEIYDNGESPYSPHDKKAVSNALRKIYIKCQPIIVKWKSEKREVFYHLRVGYKDINFEDLRNLYLGNIEKAELFKKYNWPKVGITTVEEAKQKIKNIHKNLNFVENYGTKVLTQPILTEGYYLIQFIKAFIIRTEGTEDGDSFMRGLADIVMQDFKNYYGK